MINSNHPTDQPEKERRDTWVPNRVDLHHNDSHPLTEAETPVRDLNRAVRDVQDSLGALNESLLRESQEIKEQNATLTAQLEELVQYKNQQLEKEAILEKRRMKRRSRSRQRVQQRVTFEEFQLILTIASRTFLHRHVRARVMVALTLLYLTGLRISNLLLFHVQNINELLEHAETEVPLIRGGKKRHLLPVGTSGQKLLSELLPEIRLIQSTQIHGLQGIFFHSMEDPSKPLDRTNLNKQCNKPCQKASVLLGKHIRSHSFRATLVTDLLEEGVPIDKVKDLIGHRDISITQTYRRSEVGIVEARNTLGRLQRARTQKAKRSPSYQEPADGAS